MALVLARVIFVLDFFKETIAFKQFPQFLLLSAFIGDDEFYQMLFLALFSLNYLTYFIKLTFLNVESSLHYRNKYFFHSPYSKCLSCLIHLLRARFYLVLFYFKFECVIRFICTIYVVYLVWSYCYFSFCTMNGGL